MARWVAQVAQADKIQVECHPVAMPVLALADLEVHQVGCLQADKLEHVQAAQVLATQARVETQATCLETRLDNRNEERKRYCEIQIRAGECLKPSFE